MSIFFGPATQSAVSSNTFMLWQHYGAANVAANVALHFQRHGSRGGNVSWSFASPPWPRQKYLKYRMDCKGS